MAQTITSSDLGNDQQSQLNQQNQGTPQQAGQSGATPAGGSSTAANGGAPTGGQVTGQPSGGSGAQPQSTIQSYNPNQQKGSGYTNIQSVLNANKNNQLGNVVGSGIQGQANQTQQNLNQAQNQFQQQTNQNTANTDANNQLVTNVLGNTANYVTGQPGAQQGQQFQQLISGQYAGPTALNNAQQLQNQAANVNQMGQATGSQAGQIGLLKQFVGGPQYTQGQQSLDQLLLGQPSNAPQLAAARRAALQLQGQVNTGVNSAQAVGQQQQNIAQQYGQNVQNQFGQTVSGIDTGLQQQAQTEQGQANAQYQQALGDLQSGKINQQEAGLLGITNGEQITNNALGSVGQFLTQNPNQATAQNVANAQNYAQIDALRQLGGNFAPQAAQTTLQQYAGQDQNANQFNTQQNLVGNAAGFQAAVNPQVQAYNQQITAAATPLEQAQSNVAAIQADTGGGSNPFFAGARNAALQQAQAQEAAQNNAYMNVFNQLQSTYGGMGSFNINPQVAALQQIASTQGTPQS